MSSANFNVHYQQRFISFQLLVRMATQITILTLPVTSENLLTDVDCQVTDDITTYQACMASPEHVVQSQSGNCRVNVTPVGSTCGATVQRYCTLVNCVVFASSRIQLNILYKYI